MKLLGKEGLFRSWQTAIRGLAAEVSMAVQTRAVKPLTNNNNRHSDALPSAYHARIVAETMRTEI